MPLYEYECLKCGERFEIIQKFSDKILSVHTEQGDSPCNGEVRKLLAAPAIQFKGSGWYVTDYGKGGKKPPFEDGDSAGKKKAASSESSDAAAKKAKAPSKSGDSSATKAAASS